MRGFVVSKPFLRVLRTTHLSCRWILSNSYYCEEAWKARMVCPILKKVDIGEYVMKIKSKFEVDGAASTLDMEILANTLDQIQPQQLDFAQNLFEKHRKSRESLAMSSSLPHALVRSLLSMGETGRLLEIIQEKIKYGVFLDNYCTNMLLDHFIKNEQYEEAASIAYDQMLQEDFSDELTKALSWYACHLQWKNTGIATTTDDAEEEASSKEEEEDEYIRVDYIRRPFYDDHFDIPKDTMKLGKTFVMLAQGRKDITGLSYSLVGWGYYEKFDKGLELLQSVLDAKDAALSRESVESFHSYLESLETKEPPEEEIELGRLRIEDVYPYISQEQKDKFLAEVQEIIPKLESSNKITDFNLEDDLLKYVNEVILRKESEHIQSQKDLFNKWTKEREDNLTQELLNQKILERKKAIAERLLELQRKEEKLLYFDEQEKIHLGISRAPKQRTLEKIFDDEQYVSGPMERAK